MPFDVYPLLEAGGGSFWSNFRNGMDGFFKHGLAGEGAAGIGVVIASIGFVFAGISFVAHKFNPQSKLPSWISCIIMGVVGAFITAGLEKPMHFFEWGRDTLYSWLGI